MPCTRRPRSATDTPGREIARTVASGLSVICTNMCPRFIWIWDSCGSARCRGVPCGRARHWTVWTTSGGHTMCCRISSRLASKSFSCHGLSGVRLGWMLSNLVIREYQRMSCSSAKYSSRWYTTTGCSGGGCPITHFARATSADYGCSCRRRRPWRSEVWHLQFRAVRSHHVMFAPVMRRLSIPGRHNVSAAGCGRLEFGTSPFVYRLRRQQIRLFRT